MRKYIILLIVAGFFAAFIHAVIQKEILRTHGTRLTLALAPVDPRSLMQGDYMILRYDIAAAVQQALREGSSEARNDGEYDAPRRGAVFILPDADGVGRFAGLDTGGEPPAGAIRLAYMARHGGVAFGAESFFFQEGLGETYAEARFAVLRVAADGTALSEALLDRNMRPISP